MLSRNLNRIEVMSVPLSFQVLCHGPTNERGGPREVHCIKCELLRSTGHMSLWSVVDTLSDVLRGDAAKRHAG